MYAFQEFVCNGGSGSFIMKVNSRFDFATFEFEGQQDVGTWEIEEGTGSYSDLAGSGDLTLDWDNEEVIYSCDIQTGWPTQIPHTTGISDGTNNSWTTLRSRISSR